MEALNNPWEIRLQALLSQKEPEPGAAKNAEQLKRAAAQFRVAEKLQRALSAAGLQAPSGCQDLTREMPFLHVTRT